MIKNYPVVKILKLKKLIKTNNIVEVQGKTLQGKGKSL